MYIVKDKTNQEIARFDTWQSAHHFAVAVMGRPDWKIVSPAKQSRKSTERQKKAVRWCEYILEYYAPGIVFTGNIQSFDDCSDFLSKWLNECETFMTELEAEFRADRGY